MIRDAAERIGPRRHRLLLMVGAICAALAVPLGAWAYWMCDLATYACPATGCGDVPARNFLGAIGASEILAPALLLLAGSSVLLAR